MRKSQLSESKQKLASCLPSGSDVCGAKLHEHPPESNAEKLAYSAEASRMSMERSFMKMQKCCQQIQYDISDFVNSFRKPPVIYSSKQFTLSKNS